MSFPLMYDIGYKVGLTIRNNTGINQLKDILFDANNGTEDADGLTQPTSNFMKAVSTANNYLESNIKVLSVNGLIVYTDVTYIKNKISFGITNNTDNNLIQISFYKIDDSTLSKLQFENSYVVFKNIEFIIPNDISNTLTDFNILITPFIAIHSTLVFQNCKFTFESDQKLVAFVGGINSTVYVDSCHFSGQEFTFMYGISTMPNLLITNNITDSSFLSSGISLQDKNSNWIQYQTLNNE